MFECWVTIIVAAVVLASVHACGSAERKVLPVKCDGAGKPCVTVKR